MPGLGGYFGPGPWKGNEIIQNQCCGFVCSRSSILSSTFCLCSMDGKVVNLIEIKSQARRGCDEIIQKQKVGQKPGSECLYFRIGSEKYLF